MFGKRFVVVTVIVIFVHILVCLSVLLNHATSFYVNKNISNTATGLTQM